MSQFTPEGEAAFSNPEIDPSLSRERLAGGERLLAQGDFMGSIRTFESIYGAEEKLSLTKGRAARKIAQAAGALYDSDTSPTNPWQATALEYAHASFGITDTIVESQDVSPTTEALRERAASATLLGSHVLKETIRLELTEHTLDNATDNFYVELAEVDIARANDLEDENNSNQYEIDALQTWSMYESLHGERAKGLSFALKAIRTAHKAERDNDNLNFLQKKRVQANRFVGGLAALQVNLFATGADRFPSLRRQALLVAQRSL